MTSTLKPEASRVRLASVHVRASRRSYPRSMDATRLRPSKSAAIRARGFSIDPIMARTPQTSCHLRARKHVIAAGEIVSSLAGQKAFDECPVKRLYQVVPASFFE